MKTPIIIALSIVGVLGTAGAAMAVNAGTLASVQQSNLGNAPTSLTPSGSPTPSDDRTEHATPEPGEHATPEPGDDNGVHLGTASPSPSASHDVGDDNGGQGGGDDNSGPGSSNSGSGSDDSGSGHGGHGSDD